MEFLSQNAKLVQDGVLQNIEVDDFKCTTFESSEFKSGAYLPTFSNPVGNDAQTNLKNFYQRVGNLVSGWGHIQLFTDGTVTQTSIRCSLPVPKTANFADEFGAIGCGSADDTGSPGNPGIVSVKSNGATQTLDISCVFGVALTNDQNVNVFYTYSYKVNDSL